MGFLEDPSVAQFASDVVAAISSAEREVGVELTPAAGEIAALFVVGAAYEGDFVAGRIDETSVDFASVVARQLPDMLRSIPSRGVPDESGRRLVKAADLWHWLGSGTGEALLRTWPYEKG